MAANETVPEHHQNQRAGADGDDIAERGGKLGTENARDVFEKLVIARGAVAILNDTRESGPGHEGLLGGEGEMVVLHEHKTDGLVEVRLKNPSTNSGRCPWVAMSYGGGADGEQAAAEWPDAPHLQIFGAVVDDDIVLAGFSRPFDNLALPAAEICCWPRRAHCDRRCAPTHDFAEQTFSGGITRWASRRRSRREMIGFNADQAAMDDVERVDHAEIHAAQNPDGPRWSGVPYGNRLRGRMPGLYRFGNTVTGANTASKFRESRRRASDRRPDAGCWGLCLLRTRKFSDRPSPCTRGADQA